MNTHIVVADEVARALAEARPVVALETTLVTHGLPHPAGVDVAMALEDDVRAGGAVPATIGILDGHVRVGVTRDELLRLATSAGVAKLNPGNLAAALARGRPGSTTVAATILAAHAAGIRVMATGGIGGVHRGESGDVSADLTTLARVTVAVVCAGAKAILDLPKTVEMIETLGVPVYGVGTDEFPAFYGRTSGLPVDARCDDIESLARAVATHFALGLGTGVLVANPIPEADALPDELYQGAVLQALAEAEAQGVRGRAVTPFLLGRLHAITGGVSVTANVALLRHNARVAASLAAALGVRS